MNVQLLTLLHNTPVTHPVTPEDKGELPDFPKIVIIPIIVINAPSRRTPHNLGKPVDRILGHVQQLLAGASRGLQTSIIVQPGFQQLSVAESPLNPTTGKQYAQQ